MSGQARQEPIRRRDSTIPAECRKILKVCSCEASLNRVRWSECCRLRAGLQVAARKHHVECLRVAFPARQAAIPANACYSLKGSGLARNEANSHQGEWQRAYPHRRSRHALAVRAERRVGIARTEIRLRLGPVRCLHGHSSGSGVAFLRDAGKGGR